MTICRKSKIYYKYVKDSTKILKLFHHLLLKDVPFECTQRCQDFFQKIKNYLISTPERQLRYIHRCKLRWNRGSFKTNTKRWKRKSVAYFSKKFTDVQKKRKKLCNKPLEILADTESFYSIFRPQALRKS